MALGRRGGKVISRAHPRTSLGDTLGISHVQIPQRHRIKGPKDTIMGITVPDIRRIARRGGVKRIRVDMYNEMRKVLRQYLEEVRIVVHHQLT
jgi:histone H4